MKTRLKLIYLLSTSLLLLSGCTKKNTSMSPDKKKAAAAAATQKPAEGSKPDASTPSPTPLETPAGSSSSRTLPPVDESASDSAAVDTPAADTATSSSGNSSTTTDSSATAVSTPAPTTSATMQPQASSSASPQPATPPTPELPPVEDQAAAVFEKCLEGNAPAIVSTIKAIAPREPTPSNFLTLKNLLVTSCQSKLGGQANGVDASQFDVTKILVTEALRAFPNFEPVIKFFNAIEKNETMAPEQKENIYKAYGSGGEISSKDIHFYGKLEGSKASPNVISYLITHATGTRTTRVFTGNSEIKKTVTDLKSSPKTTNRYTFDFSPSQNNTYTLNISNGEAKLVVNVTFVKGDIKTLRERKAVTVALTSESWSKVQEEHLRRLISTDAKELISMPFSLERQQTNMALVRTCSLDADNIACTDPDFTSRAVVKASSKTK